MNRVVLHRSPQLEVYRNSHDCPRGNILVVCFQYRLEEPCLDQPGFAEDFFAHRPVDSVYVNCASNEWYQYPDLLAAMARVREYASAWRRVVTYGSSMGGYAAIRFAALAGAHASIAVGPQYSPRAAAIAGESRFDADIKQTAFLHEDTQRISSRVDNYVIYDPLFRPDERHVRAYRQEARIIPIGVLGGGHTPTIVLAQCGLLSKLLLDLLAGKFCPVTFRRQLRRARLSSAQYWSELAERRRERGHASLSLPGLSKVVQRATELPDAPLS